MSPETIRALLDAFERSDWREMVVEVGEDRLHVSRDQLTELAPAAPAAPPVAPAAPAAGPVAAGDPPLPPVAKASSATGPPTAPPADDASSAKGTRIESPSVGLFWRAPSPGAPPFVEVGARVASGETVAIVEVMKLMNQVASPVDGVVTGILVENGASVEFGQPIVVVDPEG
ncbi:MAG TPA: acetyl-CoA carboxylase biotin carboxyl carrier protein [Solirubrobacterales bacterium]|nr:acetyl-CoA carboxylase biotin carboxyl carrier protein [Solirubrobacterales bacterium]